jgi:hypothetical protein
MRPLSKDIDAWVVFARQRRIDWWAAFALESLEPLVPLAAQALYLIEPVLGSRPAVHSLASLLEDDQSRLELRRQLATDRRA